MDSVKIAELARALRMAHGPKAPVEAARKIRQYEVSGNRAEVENWQRIRNALDTTSAPHQG